MTAIAILTCPRATANPWEYFTSTVDHIESEEIDPHPRLVVCDGEYSGPALGDRWEVLEYPRQELPESPDAVRLRRGNKAPYFWLLEQAHRRFNGDVLVLEDDLTFCLNAVRRMISLPIPADCAWVQFFSPHLFFPEAQPGLWRPPHGSFLFCQAIKFTGRTLHQLTDWARTDPSFGKFVESDQALALASYRLGLDYGAHCPDLARHAGDVSVASGPTATAEGKRQAKIFPGPDFDAMTLYARDAQFR